MMWNIMTKGQHVSSYFVMFHHVFNYVMRWRRVLVDARGCGGRANSVPTGRVRKVFRHFVDVWPSWMCVFCMADEMNS